MIDRLFFLIAMLISSLSYGKEKTLVVILAETRAHELTYKNIKENLIDIVEADLAVCIPKMTQKLADRRD